MPKQMTPKTSIKIKEREKRHVMLEEPSLLSSSTAKTEYKIVKTCNLNHDSVGVDIPF